MHSINPAITVPSAGRLLRLRAVCDVTGLPPSSVYDEMSKGAFPKPIKISARRVAWIEGEVHDWKQAKIAVAFAERARDGAA